MGLDCGARFTRDTVPLRVLVSRGGFSFRGILTVTGYYGVPTVGLSSVLTNFEVRSKPHVERVTKAIINSGQDNPCILNVDVAGYDGFYMGGLFLFISQIMLTDVAMRLNFGDGYGCVCGHNHVDGIHVDVFNSGFMGLNSVFYPVGGVNSRVSGHGCVSHRGLGLRLFVDVNLRISEDFTVLR